LADVGIHDIRESTGVYDAGEERHEVSSKIYRIERMPYIKKNPMTKRMAQMPPIFTCFSLIHPYAIMERGIMGRNHFVLFSLIYLIISHHNMGLHASKY
jgi:hypothetical protein